MDLEQMLEFATRVMTNLKPDDLGKPINELNFESLMSRNEEITTNPVANANSEDPRKTPLSTLTDAVKKMSENETEEIQNRISILVNNPLIDAMNDFINDSSEEDLKKMTHQIHDIVSKFAPDDKYQNSLGNFMGDMWYNRENENKSCINCDRPITNEEDKNLVRFYHEEYKVEIPWNCFCLNDISKNTLKEMIIRKFLSLEESPSESEEEQYGEILYRNASIFSEEDSKKITAHFEQKFADSEFKKMILSRVTYPNVSTIKGD